jgi:DNA-binding CsgD family transcriptional regulator
MERGLAIEESDVRSVVRLLGRIAGMNASQVERKRHLMDGLCRLVGADAWLWSVTRVLHEQSRPVSVGLLHGGLDDRQIAGWLEASQSDCPPPEDAPLSAETLRGVHFTRTRQQLVPDGAWYAHPAVQVHRLRLGLDHFLYSIYPVPQVKVWSCIGMFRVKGRQAFSDRDRRLAHIVTSEITWLHRAGIPEDHGVTVPQLAPRRRAVLIMLLDGLGRKDIARLLRISPHTAKEHMDGVYAHFGVSSQVELICRFKRGDGGDMPRN